MNAKRGIREAQDMAARMESMVSAGAADLARQLRRQLHDVERAIRHLEDERDDWERKYKDVEE